MKSYEEHIQDIDTHVEKIVERVSEYMGGYSQIRDDIFEAYEFAKEAHKKDIRLSGEPYISHPVAATELLLDLKPDISTIQACLMHDVIEDTDFTSDDILEIFGEDVANLCNGVSKLEKVKFRGEERSIGSLRKMFVAMADDIRVIFIKLADRLHNMRTLMSHPKPEKRERIALETLNIYVPIAGRLGLYNVKNDLQEECFKILHPEERKKLIKQLADLELTRREFMNSAVAEIQNILSEHDIAHRVDFRVKSPYSIYKKMTRKGIEHPKDLYDIYGIRIVVGTVSDCYRVLGEIHAKWHTLPYRFKDYIALPKPNGYQSLHTTIIGFLKNYTHQPTEIQIRTEEMHKKAEIGIAAHFEYKEKGSRIATDIDWVQDLKETVDSIGNSDFISNLKIDTFKNRIFVFTPKGDPINLPVGSTPIDFAYNVHTDLGNHIAISKVNGAVYPLDKELANGDIIEIIIDKNRTPSPYWLSFVKTIKAKNNIKAYLRKGDKDTHRDRGKEIMNRYLEKSGLSVFDKDLGYMKVLDGRELNMEERWQILEQIGNFSITPASLLKRIHKSLNIQYEKKESQNSTEQKTDKEQIPLNVSTDVVIGGEEGIAFKTCKSCIKKIIPEHIVAHINSRGQFTIHSQTCPVLKGVNKERLMNAYLKGTESQSLFRLQLILENKIGMMKIISETLFSMEINIEELHSKKLSKNKIELNIALEIHDYDYLVVDRFLDRIKLLLGDSFIDFKVKRIHTT